MDPFGLNPPCTATWDGVPCFVIGADPGLRSPGSDPFAGAGGGTGGPHPFIPLDPLSGPCPLQRDCLDPGGAPVSLAPPSLRRSGESFLQCVQRNSSKFSVAGLLDAVFGASISESFLGNLVAGNDITGLVVGLTGSSESNATEGVAAVTSGSLTHVVPEATGSPFLTSGPNGLQRLFPKVGRPAQALLRSGALKETLEAVSGAAQVKLGVDALFAAALAVACR